MIDENWARHRLDRIFPVKDPVNQKLARAQEHLGFFLCEPKDELWLSEAPDNEFLSYLKERSSIDPRIVLTSQWDESVSKERNWIFAGISQREIQLASLGEKGLAESENFERWNEKTYLWNLARELCFPFPETILLNTKEHKSEAIPFTGERSWMLKANRSSGGSGLLGGSNVDRIWSYIQRAGQADPDESWLLQERLERISDYSLCGSSLEKKPKGFLVTYDANHSSWLHQSVSPENIPFDFLSVFERLADRLRLDGYGGHFGIDGFLAKDDRLFPAVDLNVRWEKTGLLAKAAQAFSFEEGSFACARARVRPAKTVDFREIRESLDSKWPQLAIGHFAKAVGNEGEWAFELMAFFPSKGSEEAMNIALDLRAHLLRHFQKGANQ
jgi:hypothetical protein